MSDFVKLSGQIFCSFFYGCLYFLLFCINPLRILGVRLLLVTGSSLVLRRCVPS